MNIAELVMSRAETVPDAKAIIGSRRDRCEAISYSTLELAARRKAALLLRHGFRKGDLVLTFLPMSIDLYVALLAMLRLGIVPMFIDPSAGK